MARKKGTAGSSRVALVEAAWQLLLRDGSRALRIETIVARAGLSKGTFFHFFPSKQALLSALCERIAAESWRAAGELLEAGDGEPIDRLRAFLEESRSWRLTRSRAVATLWSELTRPENAALMHAVRSLGVERLAPALARVLADATQRGQLAVRDPEVSAHLVIEWLTTSAEGTLGLLRARRDPAALALAARRANATLAGLERMLGAPERALGRVQRAQVAKLAAGFGAGTPPPRSVPGPGGGAAEGRDHERRTR